MTPVDPEVAAFVAGLTAGATHEIRNVLAIVRESAGLIGDLAQAGPDRLARSRDALERALGRIDAQVGRGAEIVSALNRFAHGLERGEGSVDLAEEAALAVTLGRRGAGQRRHVLELRPSEGACPATAAPLPLQMALAAAVAHCLDQLPDPGKVTVQAARGEHGAAVEIRAESGTGPVAAPAADGAGWRRLVELARACGATIEAAAGACGVRLVWTRGGGPA